MQIRRHLRVAAVLSLALAVAAPADAQRPSARQQRQQAAMPTAEDLQVGKFVQIEGRVVDDTVVATQIEFYPEPRDEGSIEAAVDAVDAEARTLTVMGRAVSTSDETEFENGDTDLPILFSDIGVGDKAKVKGVLGEDGIFIARKVKVTAWEEDEAQEDVKIKAPIAETDLENDTFVVFATSVTVDSTTEYQRNE